MGMFDRFRKKPLPLVPSEVVVQVTIEGPLSGAPPGYESPYLDGDLAAELLVPEPDGLPPLHFTPHGDAIWLAEDTTGKLVNVATRQLRRLGIWSCRVRGDAYAEGTLRLGVVELVREPDNPHDKNAVSIRQDGQHLGYFNKGMAPGLARVLDAGEQLQAVGISVDPPKVVATSPEIMEHLVRQMR